MGHRQRIGLVGVLALLVGTAGATAAQVTPAGRWQTVSDVDGKPTAVIELREVDGAYVGTVRELLVPASPEDSVCGKCSGERRGQRIVGMEILRGMRGGDGGAWGGGEILDPESGRTYKATMRLSGDGRTLIVRGYIGVSLFGRSQAWVRAP